MNYLRASRRSQKEDKDSKMILSAKPSAQSNKDDETSLKKESYSGNQAQENAITGKGSANLNVETPDPSSAVSTTDLDQKAAVNRTDLNHSTPAGATGIHQLPADNAMDFNEPEEGFDPSHNGPPRESIGADDDLRDPAWNGGHQRPSLRDKFKYNKQQCVEVKVVFERILDIDTLSQQFEAEVYIQAKWTEEKLKGMSEEELGAVEFSDCWDPALRLLNLIGEADSEKAYMMLRYEPDRAYPVMTYMWYVKGLFRESLELEHFPLDVQDLSVVISTSRLIEEVDINLDFFDTGYVKEGAMRETPEWTTYRHVDATRDVTTFEMISTSKHPVLVVAAHARRKLGFYFWNVAIIVFLILGLSLTLLALDPTGTDRIGVTMTLFLTAVAFKLVVKTTLPTISYLTYLDIYVVFTLIYLALQAAENAMMCHLARFRDRNKVLFYDEISQICLISLLIVFHLAFILYIQLTALSKRREMKSKDHAFLLSQITKKRAKKGGQIRGSMEESQPGRQRETFNEQRRSQYRPNPFGPNPENNGSPQGSI